MKPPPKISAATVAKTAATGSTDYQRAVAYLYQHINYERTAETVPYRFRLRRMNELLDRLDLRGIAGGLIPVVHVAGTKGKGSTSAMVAAMLSAGGYRTGLYTSPHLERLEERFTVDGQQPSESEVVTLIQSVAEVADLLTNSDLGEATFFELVTAMALAHFRNRGCDAVVLEAGLGGKLDSTNVCQPTVTAITSIGLDHQHILGNTLGEIAMQKAGIIKPGVPAVSGVVHPDARLVITATAEEKQSPLFELGKQFEFRSRSTSSASHWRTDFDLLSHHPSIHSRTAWNIPLDGDHQAGNAALACVIIDLLATSTSHRVVSMESQRLGLSQTKIAGRVERFRLADGVDVILDTAHNVDSITALCKCIEHRREGRPVTVVFGTSRDKDHGSMLALLSPLADTLILTRYHANPRFRDPIELQAAMPPNASASIESDPRSALETAIEQTTGPRLIVVCGSFFLAAEVRLLLTNAVP